MKVNVTKCHLLVNKKNEVIMRIGDMEIKNREYEKLLGIKVDTKLSFSEYLNDLISKDSRKVDALSRVMPYMSLFKKKRLVSSFSNSEFSYCRLIRMFHGRVMNNNIMRRERYMRGADVYYTGTKRLLLKDYQRKINLLRYALGICKCWAQKCLKYIEIYLRGTHF